MAGRRNCPACNGIGVVRRESGYAVCRCVRGTAAERQAHAKANSLGGKHRKTVTEMIEEYEHGKSASDL